MHPAKISLTQYGSGDASKGGSRSGLYISKEGSYGMEDGHGRVHNRHGFWCEKHQSKSSNNSEMRNLAEVAEEKVEAGRMEGLEIFFLTRNSVVEAMYYQVNYSNKDIFEFMLRLVYLELRGCFRLNII